MRLPLCRLPAILIFVLSGIASSAHTVAGQCPHWISGPLTPDVQGANGPILAMTNWDPDGGGPKPAVLVVGGQFSSIDGVAADNLAMWDGLVWRPVGGGANAPVRSLTVYNGWLVVGGDFYTVGGVSSPRLAAWTGTGWLTFGPGIDPTGTVSVEALTVYQGALIAGGTFLTPYKYLARWNGSGWDDMGADVYGQVVDFAQMNGDLYVAGDLGIVNPLGFVDGVVRYNGTAWSELGHPTLAGGSRNVSAVGAFSGAIWAYGEVGLQRYTGGDTWEPVGGGPCSIQSFLESGGQLYAAGYCCPEEPSDYKRVQMWDGSGWFPVGTGVGAECPSGPSQSAVNVLCDYNGLLCAGGSFDIAGGVSASNLAFWTGVDWRAPSAPVNLFALSAYGDKVGLGGYFSQASATGQAYYLASWDGTSISPLGSGTDAPVFALYGYTDASFPNNRHLIAGGSFTQAGGLAASGIARWTEPTLTPGGSWAPMGAGFSGPVFAVEPYVGGFVAGGAFVASGAAATSRVGRWDGSAWQPMGTGMNGAVRALKSFFVSFGKNNVVVAGGDFTTANGSPANRIAYWTESALNGTTPWQPMGNGFNGSVYAVERYNGSTYAAGTFTGSSSTTLNYIARYTASGWVAVGASTSGGGTNGPIYALKAIGSYLYAAGNFNLADGTPVYCIARWDGTGWSAMDGGTSGLVRALSPYATEVLAAGTFDKAGSSFTTSLARFTPTGTPWFRKQPTSKTTSQSGTVSFDVEMAPDYSILGYSWRRDEVPLTDGPTPSGSVISGASGPSLAIGSVASADSGSYDCVVSNECGDVTSSAARLTVSTGVGVGNTGPGFAFSLSVSPNPTRSAARIGFELPRPGRVRVDVFDIAGRRVALLVEGEQTAGHHEVTWTGEALNGGRAMAGIYFACLTTPDGSLVRRVAWLP